MSEDPDDEAATAAAEGDEREARARALRARYLDLWERNLSAWASEPGGGSG